MKASRGRPRGSFTQHRRLDHLRDLLERHPKGLNIYRLASSLHVSPRTARRYLKEVGREYDLLAQRVSGGGRVNWSISGRDMPRKVELRRTQIVALLAARRLFDPLKGTALYEEIALAVQKLLGLAQRPGRGPNAGLADARLEERFLYLPFAPKLYEGKAEELDDLFQAVADLRPLRMRYRGPGQAKDEPCTVLPYALVLHRDAIHAVGHDMERGKVRVFLLDRMSDTQCSTTERFELPEDFDVDDYFQGEFGIWHSEGRHRVMVDFDAEAAEVMRMRKVHASQRLASLPGGGVRLTLTIGDLGPVANWVLEWGHRAVVVGPPELRRLVAKELADALGAYEPAKSPKGRPRSDTVEGSETTQPVKRARSRRSRPVKEG